MSEKLNNEESSHNLVEEKKIPEKSRVSRGGQKNPQKPKGYRRNKNKADSSGSEVKRDEDEDADENEICIICANKIKYASLSPCNHTTCHTCTFRQRALYEKNQCLVCRSDNDTVIFTQFLDKEYGEFKASDFVLSDDKYKINFTAQYVHDETLDLLKYKCKQCKSTFDNFKTLGEHTKVDHSKYFCLICSKNKKAFISEFALYTYKQLQRHQSEGDQSGFSGHPECKHCRGKRFYSEDEFNIHIRDRHERCHICDQVSPKTADYYRDYDSLYNHFKNDHFVCSMPSCVEKRFIVFREDLDLTAHMLKEHGGLTGGNNRIVIGSGSRQFQSQLSTFNARSKKNDSRDTDVDSFETKKLRFEERAKHYLNYDSRRYQEFSDINSNYKSGKITASILLKEYQELFKGQSSNDLYLLIFEFGELLRNQPDLQKGISEISAELETVKQKELFPVLGGSSGTVANIHAWGNSTKGRSSNQQFPALSRPKKSQNTPVINNQPIRYTTVLKKNNAVKKVNINSQQASSLYRPNYLQGMNKAPSTSSLPILGQSSSTSSSSESLLQPTASISKANSSSTSSLIDGNKFPTLEKKQTKKVIPRVKQYDIADPSQWGKTPEPRQQEVEETVINNKKQLKIKKKQDKLLFKIGM